MPHPDYLLPLLTGVQLTEWEAYYKLEPPMETRFEYMMAQLSVICANPHSKKKWKAVDFLPDWLGERAQQEGKATTPSSLKDLFIEVGRQAKRREQQGAEIEGFESNRIGG